MALLLPVLVRKTSSPNCIFSLLKQTEGFCYLVQEASRVKVNGNIIYFFTHLVINQVWTELKF